MAERDRSRHVKSKVPEVTIGFWIIKIVATTLGETGGDTLTMSWLGETTAHPNPFGYLIGAAITAVVLLALVWAQIMARRFNAWLYWLTIIASTTCGTALADFADRTLGIGYAGGSILLLACVLGSLYAWWRTLGTVDVNTVAAPPAEAFYWLTITFSQTLGTALGDWVADAGAGYAGGAAVFAAAIAIVAWLYWKTKISRVWLFWAAFVLTRPLGATLGDFLDKPLGDGGLAISRSSATVSLLIAMALLIAMLPQHSGRNAVRKQQKA